MGKIRKSRHSTSGNKNTQARDKNRHHSNSAACVADVTSYLLAYHAPSLIENGGIVYHACVIPVGIGTCLNPFIYALQSEKFRIEMRKMISCCSSSRGHSRRHEFRDNLEAPHPLPLVTFVHYGPRDSSS